ncbi:MAG: hypothetical protein WAL99_12580 [Pseudonocardiaceae bacterium]
MAEARELRAGGPVVVAQAVGVAADTVRRGRGHAELDDPVLPPVGYLTPAATPVGTGWGFVSSRPDMGCTGAPCRYRRRRVADTRTVRWAAVGSRGLPSV